MHIIEIPTLSRTGGAYLSNDITLNHIKDTSLQKAINNSKIQSVIKMGIGKRQLACLKLDRYINNLEKVISCTYKSDYVSMLNIILTNAKAKKEMITQLAEYEVITSENYEDLPLVQKMDIFRLYTHVHKQNIWPHANVDEDILAVMKVPILYAKKDGDYDFDIIWFVITGTMAKLAVPIFNKWGSGRYV